MGKLYRFDKTEPLCYNRAIKPIPLKGDRRPWAVSFVFTNQKNKKISKNNYRNKTITGTGERTMSDQQSLISNAFQTFASKAPQHAQAWRELVQRLADASALDAKTGALAYLAVLAVRRIESGIPFHVLSAKKAGASRDEVISAILLGLPLAGNVVTQVLPAALAAYDSAELEGGKA